MPTVLAPPGAAFRHVALAGATTEHLGQLAQLAERGLAAHDAATLPARFCFDVYFGATDFTPLAELARTLFAACPVALLRFECVRDDGWTIRATAVHDIARLDQRQQRLRHAALDAFARAPVADEITPRYRIQW